MGASAGRVLAQVGSDHFVTFLDNWSTASIVGWNANDIANIDDAESALSVLVQPTFEGHWRIQVGVIDYITWYEPARKVGT